MLKTFGLAQQVIATKWLESGLFANANGSLARAFTARPVEAGDLEEGYSGPETERFFAKLADLLSRLPNGFEGQIVFQRRDFWGDGLISSLFLFETVKNAKAYSHWESFAGEIGLTLIPLGSPSWRALLTGMVGCKGRAHVPDLLWDRSGIRQKDTAINVVSLTELPQVTWSGCLRAIFEENKEFTFSLKIALPSRDKTKKQLETKRRVNHALSIASSLELQNIESNSVLSSSEETLERILVGKEALFEVSAALIFTSPIAEAKNLAQEYVALGSGIGNAGFYHEGVGALPVFKSHIPGNKMLKIRTLPILSQNLAGLLPVVLDYSIRHAPTRLDLRARNGEKCNLNLFSLANLNFNGIICGASGSGKSFLMNSLITDTLNMQEKSNVVIFDVGGSYRKLVTEQGGVSKAVTRLEANALLASFFKANGKKNPALARAIIETLCGSGAHVTHSHRVAIDDLIQRVGAQDIRIGVLTEMASLQSEAYYRDLAHWLKPFEAIDDLVSFKDDLFGLENRITAFDFKELASDPVLERTTVLILSSLLWERLKLGVAGDTIVVFDEVWRFFRGVKDFIEEMYRTFRKYRAGIVSISQNAADYGDNDFARMIFSNSFTKIFLQGGANRELLTAGLDLTESDIARALSVASKKPLYSEFFVSSGAVSQVMRLFSSPEFYALANTENIAS